MVGTSRTPHRGLARAPAAGLVATGLLAGGLLALHVPLAGSSGSAADDVHILPVSPEASTFWSRWRGPSGQGRVTGHRYPDRWAATENLAWRVAVPGEGNSSPIVWGDRLFLTTARDGGHRVSLLGFNRTDGRLLWERSVAQEGVESGHPKNGYASATPVTDGERVYASFGSHGLLATDLDGNVVWHRKLGPLNNYHGSAGSPILYDRSLIIYQDHQGSGTLGSFVAAFDVATGRTLWWTDRRETTGWGTPIVIRAGERDELIVSSQRKVYAYDPATGQELWTVRGNTFEVIPTPVVGHGLVFCSSGRAGPTMAIRPGGRGDVTDTHVVWKTPKGSPFVPSGLVDGDHLYLVNDMMSVLTAYEARTGTLVYQERLGEPRREGFSASPVAIDGKLFFTSDSGETFVVAAGATFKLLHVNRLGAPVLASPALVGGTWYVRTASELLAIGS
jgi:outer membrane protein assembly factor BamB